MDSIKEKVQKLNLVPSVAEEISAALEKEGIIEDERLDIILPALAGALQISKPDDEEGKYNVTLISAAGEVLTKDDKLWTIAEWISDYSFEPENADNRKTISYEDSLKPSAEQIEQIASGKLKVLPQEKAKSDGVPASELKEKSSRNEVSVEDVASGKTQVDMSK